MGGAILLNWWRERPRTRVPFQPVAEAAFVGRTSRKLFA